MTQPIGQEQAPKAQRPERVLVGSVTTEAAHIAGLRHLYVSTGCQHGFHDYCKRSDTKKPARCKFCTAPCLCPCHTVTA